MRNFTEISSEKRDDTSRFEFLLILVNASLFWTLAVVKYLAKYCSFIVIILAGFATVY